MTNVIFNSGFLGFLIWLLLFAVSTTALAIGIRCAWNLRKALFGSDAEFPTAMRYGIKTLHAGEPAFRLCPA